MNSSEINASAIFTQEMKATLMEINELIEYARLGGKPLQHIKLSVRQWEPIRKDRKRENWKIPRSCGLIHYEKDLPQFEGVILEPPSAAARNEYFQADAFA